MGVTSDHDDVKALYRSIERGESFSFLDNSDPQRRRYAKDLVAFAVEHRLPVAIDEWAMFDGSRARVRPEGPLVGGTETTFTPLAAGSQPVNNTGGAVVP